MSYGSANTAADTAAFLNRIYGGTAPHERIREFENRYRLIGRSPLVEITTQQAALLEEKLGNGYVVRAGMRHSEPFVAGAVKACRDAGATEILGVILSPQQGSFMIDGYQAALIDAALENGYSHADVHLVEAWPAEGHFVELLSERIKTSLSDLSLRHQTDVPVVFTTHSLPKAVIEKDKEYLSQLGATIQAVLDTLDRDSLSWYAGYQSAGHAPGEWMKPDLTDILAELAEEKVPAVLIVPIQFLADHLEVLYDLDIAARKQCEEYGIEYNRIALPNTDPLFISALKSIAKKGQLSY